MSCPRRLNSLLPHCLPAALWLIAGLEALMVSLAAMATAMGAAEPIAPSPGPGSIPPAAADYWLTNVSVLSIPRAGVTETMLAPALFAGLRAEVLGGRLRISWQPEPPGAAVTFEQLTIVASAAEPGQWPLRDWRSYPMKKSGNVQQADIPVEDLDIPIVYYARGTAAQGDRLSPLRLVYPRRLGLEEPTQIFWPFIEGFENGAEGWWIGSRDAGERDAAALRTSPASKNGRAALQISLPPRQGAIRLATTRVRGWQLLQEGATGLRFWVRTRSGNGSVRCSLQARTSTTNQVIGAWPKEVAVGDHWRKIDLSFTQLPILPWRSVDLFVMEFRAQGPVEFLLDDVQLLGPWKLHPE